MSEPVITVDNLGKTYWLYPNVWSRLLGCFIEPRRVGARAFHALSGLCFELHPGEAIALIGKNGAGKSTALQMLAGITPPSEGSFHIHGRVCALLELGSGFNPEFTGRQNIALAGMLLGLTREQIREEEQNIIDFADIGEFIDQPVKFYSSGMFVRLAFAVAVAGQPDLLIVDEALAVGDIFFRQKCYVRLRKMRERGMAVILVTHSSGDAQEFCDRAILLEHGHQTYIGDPQEAMLRYYISMQGTETTGKATNENKTKAAADESAMVMDGTGFPWPHLEQHFMAVPLEKQRRVPDTSLVRFCLVDADDRPTVVITQGSIMKVYGEYRIASPVEIPSTGVTIWSSSGVAVYSKSTVLLAETCAPVTQVPAMIYTCHEITMNIACGEYTLSCGLSSIKPEVFAKIEYCGYEAWTDGSQRLANIRDLASITVVLPFSHSPSRVVNFGLVNLPSKASISARV